MIRCTAIRKVGSFTLLRRLLLPAAVHCLRASMLCAKLRRSNIDGALERAKGGAHCRSDPRTLEQSEDYPARGLWLCREELMSWCEQNAVDYVFGLAKNVRLVRSIGAQLRARPGGVAQPKRPARRFKELKYRTRKSWCRRRGSSQRPSKPGTNRTLALS